MSNCDPKKPVWDKSEEGALPEELATAFAESKKIAAKQKTEYEIFASLSHQERLDRLDAKQAEVVALANSPAAALMTDEQRFISTWQREATVARASLEAFQNKEVKVEKRATKIKDCKRRLAVALYKLGKIDEALTFSKSYPDILRTIKRVQKAKEIPDDEFLNHTCQRPTDESDGKVIELDRRWQSEEVISEIHGELVKVWSCSVCGLSNAVPFTPERQARYTPTMLATIHGLAKGDTPAAKGIIESPALRQFEVGAVMGKAES